MPLEEVFSAHIYDIVIPIPDKCFAQSLEIDDIFSRVIDRCGYVFESDREKICYILEILLEELFLYKELDFWCIFGPTGCRSCIIRIGITDSSPICPEERGLKKVLEVVFVLES